MQISFDQCDPLQPLVRINNEEHFAGAKPEEQKALLAERFRWEPPASGTARKGELCP